MEKGLDRMKKRTIKNTELQALMRKAGFSRISDDATAEFGKILERIAIKLAKSAKVTMETGGRKTPKGLDFKSAYYRSAKKMGQRIIDVNTEGEHDLCLTTKE
jgi:histone H3/H4